VATREKILGAVEDMVADFLYYDRKADQDLPVGTIEIAIANGTVSVADIEIAFCTALRKALA
jgi:hypothetical protein